MEMKNVQSSHLKAVGYDNQSQILVVQFHGTYFDRNIKKHPERYPYIELT